MRFRGLLPAVCFVACASESSVPAGGAEGGDPDFTPKVELGRHSLAVSASRQIVPSPGLPQGLAHEANNNVAAIRHEGRTYVAWRTSKTHYASADTIMQVVSSADETTWTLETSLALGTDLREPNFLVLGGELYFYFSKLGKDSLAFEPQGIFMTKRAKDGIWSAPVATNKAGYVGWRTKSMQGTPIMLAYVGGEHLYKFDGVPMTVERLTTTDGVSFEALPGAAAAVGSGGTTETDYDFLPDGTGVAIMRNEAGDASGWGSKVCTFRGNDPWECRTDKRKYDSPYVFAYDGEVYLVGRRNLTETGNYDLDYDDLDTHGQTVAYQIDYTRQRKRCAVWRFVPNEKRMAFVADLPSRGDTCFPHVIEGSQPGEFVVYDYSSPLDGRDLPWSDAQRGETRIYRHVLRFQRR